MYRIGFPGWKIAARLGLPLSMRVHIHFDAEVASYWTTSPDLGGLIVTGQTLDELFKEVQLASPDLIALELGKPAPRTKTTFTPIDHFLPA
jgi:predicted RNase H-like HicB family nuclease